VFAFIWKMFGGSYLALSAVSRVHCRLVYPADRSGHYRAHTRLRRIPSTSQAALHVGKEPLQRHRTFGSSFRYL